MGLGVSENIFQQSLRFIREHPVIKCLALSLSDLSMPWQHHLKHKSSRLVNEDHKCHAAFSDKTKYIPCRGENEAFAVSCGARYVGVTVPGRVRGIM